MQKNYQTIIFLIIILALAIFFRFYHLNQIPPGLYPDVAMNGNDAITALKANDFRVFYPENNGREGLFINLIALSFYFWGVSVWAIKVVPAIIGTLTVLGLYLMTRELFLSYPRQIFGLEGGREILPSAKSGQKFASADLIALLSAFFLATSFWHVNFSRLGFRAIMVPFILVWSFYFLFRAIRMTRMNRTDDTDKFYEAPRPACGARYLLCKADKITHWMLVLGYWILAGLVFGLGFHTYIAFRIAPAIIAVVFLIEIYNARALIAQRYNYWLRRKSDTKTILVKMLSLWLVLFIALIIAALPMIIYFYHHSQDFMGRTGQVSVLASPQPLKGLALSTAKTLGMFNVWGDCNWRHNIACQPELPLPVGILFLIGLILSAQQFLKGTVFLLGCGRHRANDDLGGGRDFAAESGKMVGDRPLAAQRNHWTLPQISFFLLALFFVMLVPAIITNEGLPHSLRSIGAIPATFIFAGLGGYWIINWFKVYSSKFKVLGKIMLIAFFVWLPLFSYDYYFNQWSQNYNVKGAFTQNYVDIGNYLNSLPDNVKKYVIVNEGGVPVPYPDGIPMPAQTVIFIEQTSNTKQKAFYLKPEGLANFYGLNPNANYSLIFVPMEYDEKIFDELKSRAPNGKVIDENGIWTFQVRNK